MGYAYTMIDLDKYLEELSKIYATEKVRLLPISEVIDRLLDIRNSSLSIEEN